ncbi:hypothetical protein [Photobacterium leiognathi]|nr:hypothetical protein [Photobacterium leiognathi]
MTISTAMSDFYLQRLIETNDPDEYEAILKMIRLCHWLPHQLLDDD